MKPSTNFGKRSQMIAADGFSPVAAPLRKVHQTESANAAKPSMAFWENFTITAALMAESPTISPAATTAPEVSMVPPSQAPPTTAGMSNWEMIHGMTNIMGMATTRTREVT